MAIVVNGLTASDIERKLNRTLDSLSTWFASSRLSLNLNKCKVMTFSTCMQLERIGSINVKSGDTVLEHVNKFKYLGILLDSNLNFSEHVAYLKSKLYAKIKLLGRVRMLLDHKTALTIYKTLILPVLDYCDFIYYGIYRDQETLQQLQNCAFRAILQVDRYTHTADTHISLNMDTLDKHRKKHVSVQVYKYLNCPGPIACRNMFTFTMDYHSVNTRASQKPTLVIPCVNLSMSHRNIRYFGAKIWSEIPDDIKQSSSLDTFKENVYKYDI